MISKDLYTTDEKGIHTLNSDAIESIFFESNLSSKYDNGYTERSSSYVIILKGDKRKRRVYLTPIGNVSVMYIKVKYLRYVYCETAVDEALNNV